MSCSYSDCSSDHIQDTRGKCVSISSPAGKILLRAKNRDSICAGADLKGGSLEEIQGGSSELTSEVVLLQKSVKQLMDALQHERDLNRREELKKLNMQFQEIELIRAEILKHSEKVEKVSRSNLELSGIDMRIKSDVQMLKEARTDIARLLVEAKKTLEQISAAQNLSSSEVKTTSKNLHDAKLLQNSLHTALEQFHAKHAELKTASLQLEHKVHMQLDELAKLKSSAIETFANVSEKVFQKMKTTEMEMKNKLDMWLSEASEESRKKISNTAESVINQIEDTTSNLLSSARVKIQKDVKDELQNITHDAAVVLQTASDIAKTSAVQVESAIATSKAAEKIVLNEMEEFKSLSNKVKSAMDNERKSIIDNVYSMNTLNNEIGVLSSTFSDKKVVPFQIQQSSVDLPASSSSNNNSSKIETGENTTFNINEAEIELKNIIRDFSLSQSRVQKDREQYAEIQEKIKLDSKAAESYKEALLIKQENSAALKAQYAQVSQALERVQKSSLRTPRNAAIQLQLEKAIEARELLDSGIRQIESDIDSLKGKYNAAITLVNTEIENADQFHKKAEAHILKASSLREQVTRGRAAVEIAKEKARLNGGIITEDLRFEIELEANQDLINGGYLPTSEHYKQEMHSLRNYLDGGGNE